MRSPIRFICIALLGLATAALVSCAAGSSKSLIPIQNAGPLQSDFEAVARDAREGNGSCTATEAELSKTEQDFARLPATVDRGLRTRLREGISNLRTRSLALCAQSTSTESLTNTTNTQSSTTTTNTETQPSTTPTQTTPTDTGPSTTTTPPGPEGGTPAPGTPGNTAPDVTPGNEQSNGVGNGAGGTGAGNPGGQGGGQ
jgi:hypothetical protein